MATTTDATRKRWLIAREELLEQEKDLTRGSDELARRRRRARRKDEYEETPSA